MKRWEIRLVPTSPIGVNVTLTFSSADADVWCASYGVVIQTAPNANDGWALEQVIPWTQIIDYRAYANDGEADERSAMERFAIA